MKFNFKIQQYQTDAVDAVVKAFDGQEYCDAVSCLLDFENERSCQMSFDKNEAFGLDVSLEEIGHRNAELGITDERLLKNIQALQEQNNIKKSKALVKPLGRCSLDVEMETGTGKTYVYIKTCFELNKQYGWNKYIVVVPSVAIREGVYKSFEMTAEHFMECYRKKAQFFVYNSANLHQLDDFWQGSGIHVMIINTQAFAASMKEGGRSKESRIIYSKRDEFGSRRPIDVIAATRPVIILDEPQKMGGDVTKKALKNFNPLFCLNYSATHKIQHNLVYALDALDAFNKRLVKKIEVKGFEIKKFSGANRYLYLEQILLSPQKPPKARVELEICGSKGIRRQTRLLEKGTDLYRLSGKMEQYRGVVVAEIDPLLDTVTFTNGETISTGNAVGDVSQTDMRRIQIRETILSHFEKEEQLFDRGIKTLSLFFIDEVSKYRQYDEQGNQRLGEYGTIFEEEYIQILNEYITNEDTPYQKYLKSICSDVKTVHKGYFSIDKKGRAVNSAIRRGSEFSDDISAYDLILTNKERLLSFSEPTRFIFSHSALREGWDNPNVFQICTLKYSDSQTAKRQEVGRGLRLCVDQDGNRMDVQSCGDKVHDINVLTVIASESYADFVSDLQKDMKKVLYDRPKKASKQYFKGKYVAVNGESLQIDGDTANRIEQYLVVNNYVDDKHGITPKYRADAAIGCFAPVPQELKHIEKSIHTLLQGLYDEEMLNKMFTDGHAAKIFENELNQNYEKEEFQQLWRQINHGYTYTTKFNSDELIRQAAEKINQNLVVSPIEYTTILGKQKDNTTEEQISKGQGFKMESSHTRALRTTREASVKYDLVEKLAEGAVITRKTAVGILNHIQEDTRLLFAQNPEEFIAKTIKLIRQQKAVLAIPNIDYQTTQQKFDRAVFTKSKGKGMPDNTLPVKKAIQDYIFLGEAGAQGKEKRFVQALELAQEVCVYARLPKEFCIPTPIGKDMPKWAIVFKQKDGKPVFVVVKLKEPMEQSELQLMKKQCAERLFEQLFAGKIKYCVAEDYEDLLNQIFGC